MTWATSKRVAARAWAGAWAVATAVLVGATLAGPAMAQEAGGPEALAKLLPACPGAPDAAGRVAKAREEVARLERAKGEVGVDRWSAETHLWRLRTLLRCLQDTEHSDEAKGLWARAYGLAKDQGLPANAGGADETTSKDFGQLMDAMDRLRVKVDGKRYRAMAQDVKKAKRALARHEKASLGGDKSLRGRAVVAEAEATAKAHVRHEQAFMSAWRQLQDTPAYQKAKADLAAVEAQIREEGRAVGLARAEAACFKRDAKFQPLCKLHKGREKLRAKIDKLEAKGLKIRLK